MKNSFSRSVKQEHLWLQNLVDRETKHYRRKRLLKSLKRFEERLGL